MRLPISVLFLLLMPLLAQETVAPRDAHKSARDLNPDVAARLDLALAWMSQYIPGAESPENLELARKAEAEFNQVLQVEPNNVTALASMASLIYQQAQGMPDLDQKLPKLDEAASWYEKSIAADPRNKEAYYSLAVIDSVKWYAAWTRARSDLGIRPEEPGPLPNPARQQLKQEYSSHNRAWRFKSGEGSPDRSSI